MKNQSHSITLLYTIHATPKNEKKRQQDFFYLLDKLGVTYGRGTIPFRMLDKTNTKDKRHDTSNVEL